MSPAFAHRTTRVPDRFRLTTATRLRIGLALLSLGVAAAGDEARWVLPWAAVLVVLEVAGDHARVARDRRAVVLAEVAAVLAALATTLGLTRAALVLLLVPAFRAGEQHGQAAALWVCGVLGSGAAVAAGLQQPGFGAGPVVQWCLLALGMAQLGVWESAEGRRRESSEAIAREAGALLERVQDLARRLPTGLDVPAVAHLLLDEVSAVAPADRCGVLVRVADERVTPVAVRGVERAPWRNPATTPGTAREAWITGRVRHDVRPADEPGGRRAGSAMLAVPVRRPHEGVLALVVLERSTPRAFTGEEVRVAHALVQDFASHLSAAVAFSELRHVSEVAERERLAREMHNGVAQDLSALGFALDATTKRLEPADGAAAADLRQLRQDLNRVIRDIRFSIADLRSSTDPSRGLGAAISSHLQAVGASGDVAVTLRLRESPYRLPAHHESVLLRLVQDFAADARNRRPVTALSVELAADAPHARIELVRDGGGGWVPDPRLLETLTWMGGRMTVQAVQVMAGGTQEVRAVVELLPRDGARTAEPATGDDALMPVGSTR